MLHLSKDIGLELLVSGYIGNVYYLDYVPDNLITLIVTFIDVQGMIDMDTIAIQRQFEYFDKILANPIFDKELLHETEADHWMIVSNGRI